MGILVSANRLQKTFGGRTLFSDLSFVVAEEERIGLIGPNGAGKSTLLRLLAGETSPDDGEISLRRGVRIGWLEQTPKIDGELTVEDAVLSAAHSEDNGPALASELMSRLELTDFAYRTVGELSGGWRKRVALAQELMKEPELLLLDEPTNHLDIESILWLENFLSRASFSTVTVTHDRLFLQRIANRILELDQRNPGGMLSVSGDYATYLERKEELMSIQERQETKLQNTLRRETEWLRRGPKARTTKQTARINAAADLKNQVQELHARNQTGSVSIEFQSTKKQPKRLIEGRALSKSLGGKILYRNLDVFLGPGTRLGLLGRNGCGKSTLIRTLLGLETPDHGEVLRSDQLKIAYFEQNRDQLDPNKSLRKTLCPDGDHVNYRGRMIHIHGYLDRFLFRKDQVDLPISRLSGGEQSRVLIARLMLKEANVLVLDEPTNDLDVQTLDILEECLTQFEGAVLLVTHDRFFLDQVANTILAFPYESENMPASEVGKVISFADLAQWENWHAEKLKGPKGKPAAAPVVDSAVPEPVEKKRKMSFKETHEFSQIEGKIEKAESTISALESQAALPENQTDAKKLREIFESIAKTQVEVEQLYARWSELDALQKK